MSHFKTLCTKIELKEQAFSEIAKSQVWTFDPTGPSQCVELHIYFICYFSVHDTIKILIDPFLLQDALNFAISYHYSYLMASCWPFPDNQEEVVNLLKKLSRN